MLSDLIKVRARVEYILETYPETRDSDKLLWLAYLCIFHALKQYLGEEGYRKFKTLLMDEDTVTMESVRRTRAKIQELGFFQGKKRAERMEEAETVRQHFAGDLDYVDDYQA